MFLHFSFVIFLSACAGQSYNSATFKCNQTICPPVPSMYIDLGCKPVINPGDCCPDRYECSSPRRNFCTFKGNLYSDGEKISIYDAPPCTSDCVCTRDEDNQSMTFNCPVVDCAEFFPYSFKKCIVQKDLRSCCADDIICDPETIEHLPTCYYNGGEYKKGELFYPKSDPCYRCSCDEYFSNSTNPKQNINCERVNCLLEIHNIDKIRNGCVPIYYPEANICCPINYRCPSTVDYVVSTNKSSQVHTGYSNQCTFGKWTLNVGDSLNKIDRCIKCTCRMTPYVECTKSLKC